jgi:hypothetical protein
VLQNKRALAREFGYLGSYRYRFFEPWDLGLGTWDLEIGTLDYDCRAADILTDREH